jgi:hypothetical protein
VVDDWFAFGGNPVDDIIVDLFILCIEFGLRYFHFSSFNLSGWFCLENISSGLYANMQSDHFGELMSAGLRMVKG